MCVFFISLELLLCNCSVIDFIDFAKVSFIAWILIVLNNLCAILNVSLNIELNFICIQFMFDIHIE